MSTQQNFILPQNRQISPLLQPTPHSGYHWNGSSGRFFEGWYVRVTVPQRQQSFAFMYSIEDPSGGKSHSGGAAQILGADDHYLCRSLPDVQGFWAERDCLALGHWGKSIRDSATKPGYLEPEMFDRQIQSGYQLTETWHQGVLQEPNGCSARWQHQIRPIYGWGKPDAPQKATAGVLSFLPIFEPGWQILMAHGLATGWIDWNGTRYELQNAPLYIEKNWGGAFPQKWFWLQCNAFAGHPNLTLTAGGGRRKVLWWTELVGMIGLHYQNRFYEFVPWNSTVQWEVSPWGDWHVWATDDRYQVDVLGRTDRLPVSVRVPTERGMIFACQDTTHGNLQVQLRERSQRQPVLRATSALAGLETGGAPWNQVWRSSDNPNG